MTQDEIILMADASGISLYGMGKDRAKFIHYLEAFAKLVAKHTLLNIDPSSFMSYQEGVEVGRMAERQWLIDSGLIGVLKHCEDLLREDGHENAVDGVQNMIAKIKVRGQA